MKQLPIPPRLQALLGPQRCAEAELSVTALLQWIQSTGMELPFFPEYSEHGIRHIARVLAAADALLTPATIELLTPDDAFLLTIAIVLHDSALHVREHGFLELLAPSARAPRPELDADTWQAAWQTYYAEARRWDGRMLKNILGDDEEKGPTSTSQYEDLVRYVRPPSEAGAPDQWSRKYRKFIGEFLRRQHGRLAHEIALHGMPGAPTVMPCSLPSYFADLAGLVARSHAIPLRSTFDYLNTHYYGRVTCHNAHPVFLMALLRIADFLDIQEDRAPAGLLGLKRIRSPLSLGEWHAHSSIRDVRPDETDREAIFVVASPPNARTYFRVRALLDGLQREVDTTWAVLGEVYSKHGDLGLDRLGLSLRRVRSNLDRQDEFARTVSYVPRHAAFGAADTHLLRLLVRPLYGDRPEIGIRELVQNAVDAVRELRCRRAEQHEETVCADRAVLLPGCPEADVVVSICARKDGCHPPDDACDDWEYWVKVDDRGIGMTADTVCNYLLKAGACFRESDAWRMAFLDEARHAKVCRSGRFGIGVFAAFLLGPALHVSTRHIDDRAGLRFQATVEDSELDLIRDSRPSNGTTIYVRISDSVFRRLVRKDKQASWDWFCTDDAVVARLRGPDRHLTQRYTLPRERLAPRGGWRCFRHSVYGETHWTYREPAPGLCVNGIVVQRGWNAEHRCKMSADTTAVLSVPRLCIYDRDGAVPLNIVRDSLQYDVFAGDPELLKDIIWDFMAFMVARAPRNMNEGREVKFRGERADYAGFRSSPRSVLGPDAAPWIVTHEGAIYVHPWYIARSGVQRVLCEFCDDYGAKEFGKLLPAGEVGVIAVGGSGKDIVERACHGWLMSEKVLAALPLVGLRLWVRIELLDRLKSTARFDSRHTVRPRHHNRGWMCYEQGQTEPTCEGIAAYVEVSAKAAPGALPYVLEMFMDSTRAEEAQSPLCARWRSAGISSVIPYSMEERTRMLKSLPRPVRRYAQLRGV